VDPRRWSRQPAHRHDDVLARAMTTTTMTTTMAMLVTQRLW
jgi:hypothetical protein